MIELTEYEIQIVKRWFWCMHSESLESKDDIKLYNSKFKDEQEAEAI